MSLAALAGEVRMTLGRCDVAVLASSRQDWVPRLTAGRPAASLPTLLGSLFTLCAHAHRWTAQRALAVALEGAATDRTDERAAHRLATLREQMLRIHHDWPRLLPGAPDPEPLSAQLRTAPAWSDAAAPAERLAAMPAWLARHWLGQPVADWLARWEAAPTDWPLQWLATATGPLAELLRSQRAAVTLQAPGPALRLDGAESDAWAALGAELCGRPGFALRPQWQGAVPDTGPWTRLAAAGGAPAISAWDRLIARVVEVLRLAQPEGAQWLAHGELALGDGEGLAWTEMARGLLVHRVRLAPDRQTLQDVRVLAPTEWNFHPQGVLAQALARLPADAAGAESAARLAVAFDPCVPFTVALGDTAGTQDKTCMN